MSGGQGWIDHDLVIDPPLRRQRPEHAGRHSQVAPGHDLLHVEPELTSLDDTDVEEVMHPAVQMVHLPVDPVEVGARLRPLRSRFEDGPELPREHTDQGEGGLQLMDGDGEELGLAPPGPGELGTHLVEGLCQARDLVLARGRKVDIEPAGGDLLGRGHQPVQGLSDRVYQEDAGDGGQWSRQQDRDESDPLGAGCLAPGRLLFLLPPLVEPVVDPIDLRPHLDGALLGPGSHARRARQDDGPGPVRALRGSGDGRTLRGRIEPLGRLTSAERGITTRGLDELLQMRKALGNVHSAQGLPPECEACPESRVRLPRSRVILGDLNPERLLRLVFPGDSFSPRTGVLISICRAPGICLGWHRLPAGIQRLEARPKRFQIVESFSTALEDSLHLRHRIPLEGDAPEGPRQQD